MQVDRDIKLLIKLVLHESRIAKALGEITTLSLASLSWVYNMGVEDGDRGLVMKQNMR